MSEKEEKAEKSNYQKFLEELTPKQQVLLAQVIELERYQDNLDTSDKKLLAQTLEFSESRLYQAAAKRLRNLAAGAVLVITLFGAISIAGIVESIKSSTVATLQANTEIQNDIKTQVTDAMERKYQDDVKEYVETQTARVNAELLKMKSQLSILEVATKNLRELTEHIDTLSDTTSRNRAHEQQ